MTTFAAKPGAENWILDKDGRTPIQVPLLEWVDWFGNFKNRIVKQEELPNTFRVSTVFLGLDHNFDGGKSLLFETMVFPADSMGDLDCERYSTWDEAEAGHKKMVEKWEKK